LLQQYNCYTDYGKIFVVFIELCMKWELFSALKGNNCNQNGLKTYNLESRLEICHGLNGCCLKSS